jgi:hypothetical protein
MVTELVVELSSSGYMTDIPLCRFKWVLDHTALFEWYGGMGEGKCGINWS